ncbi:MAG: hypothetical protein Q8K32_07245 [Archangium sp.]|nr:hypothetical protein [Archangium sp.]
MNELLRPIFAELREAYCAFVRSPLFKKALDALEMPGSRTVAGFRKIVEEDALTALILSRPLPVRTSNPELARALRWVPRRVTGAMRWLSGYHPQSWVPRDGSPWRINRQRFALLLSKPKRDQNRRPKTFRRIYLILPPELAEACSSLADSRQCDELPWARLVGDGQDLSPINETELVKRLRLHFHAEREALVSRLEANIPRLLPNVPEALLQLLRASPGESLAFASYSSLSLLLNEQFGLSTSEQAVKDCVSRMKKKKRSSVFLDWANMPGRGRRVLRLGLNYPPASGPIDSALLVLPKSEQAPPAPFVRKDLADIWSEHQAFLRDLLAGPEGQAAVGASHTEVGLTGDLHDSMDDLEQLLIGLLVVGQPGGCRLSNGEIAKRLGWTQWRARRVIRRAVRLLGPIFETGRGSGRVLFPHVFKWSADLVFRCAIDSIGPSAPEGEPVLPWGPAPPRAGLHFPLAWSRSALREDLRASLSQQRATYARELRVRACAVSAHTAVERAVLAWVGSRGGSVLVANRNQAALLFSEECGYGSGAFLRSVATLVEGQHLQLRRKGRAWRELALGQLPASRRGRAGFGVAEVWAHDAEIWAQIEQEEGDAPPEQLAA